MLSLSILLPASALTRYDEHGEPVVLPYEALLRCMRHMGWASRAEIFDAMEIWPVADRRAARSRLNWLVTSGYIERRGHGNHAEFRLRAEAFKARSPQCSRCQDLPVSGRKQCQRHLDYDAKFRRDQRAARRAA